VAGHAGLCAACEDRREMSDSTETGLHPLVGGFQDAAGYEAGRPRYRPEVAEVLMSGLGLAAGAPVLELGAGTGQLSRALLDAGLELTAVEPLENTRELLSQAIGTGRVLAGTAERIPLGDASVQAVFAADAFHWFDESRAMPEIRRVLAPGGGVAILRMLAGHDQPWSTELGSILMESRPEHPAFAGRGAAAALEEDPAFGPVTHASVTSPGALDRERLLAWVGSFSWVAALPADEREALVGRVRVLLEENDAPQTAYDLVQQIWYARLAQ
jgi:SAM-dependent methyltransferase